MTMNWVSLTDDAVIISPIEDQDPMSFEVGMLDESGQEGEPMIIIQRLIGTMSERVRLSEFVSYHNRPLIDTRGLSATNA